MGSSNFSYTFSSFMDLEHFNSTVSLHCILGASITYFIQSKLQDSSEKRKIRREIIEKIKGYSKFFSIPIKMWEAVEKLIEYRIKIF